MNGKRHLRVRAIHTGTTGDNLPRAVEFFFRDDDAGWDNRRLFELLDVFRDHGLPVDLAAIPMALASAAAQELLRRIAAVPDRIRVHQHGFRHVNHEVTGRNCEFGCLRDYSAQRSDIERGRQRLMDLLGPLLDPIFTPPWNRCTAVTGRCLVELGFNILSRDSTATPLGISGLEEIPIHQDWFAHRKGVRLGRYAWGELLAFKIKQQMKIGIMFHHAVMDAGERSAATQLLATLATHTRVRCQTIRSIGVLT